MSGGSTQRGRFRATRKQVLSTDRQ